MLFGQEIMFFGGNYAVSNLGQHRDGRPKCPETAQNQKTLGGGKKSKFPKKTIIQKKTHKKKKKHHLEDLNRNIGIAI